MTRTPREISEPDLDQVTGGDSATASTTQDAWPAKWKGFSLNGKGNTATTEGGFSEVSGLGVEVQVAEYREGETLGKR